MKDLNEAYREAVDYLLAIPKFANKTTHDNLRGFLRLLGNPQEAVPAIHIAGTNGKGSVCAYMAAMLQQAGKRVGMFTSPHLIRINERFQINGKEIGDEEFLEVFRQVREAVEIGMSQGLLHPNFFEYLFIMAAVWYRKQQPDYVIYETGLGGRLDATNVLKPKITVITSIGMDHMQYLGDTIEQIAGEKAGIIKPETTCVYLKQKDASAAVIEKIGEIRRSPLIPVEREAITIDEIGAETIDFSYTTRYDNTSGAYSRPTYRIMKTALYQTENAALAIEAIRSLLGKDITEAVLQEGILRMRWKGRMEKLEPRIYVDGAHNEPAIQAFCDTVSKLYPNEKNVLLFAVASDKRYNEMIHILCQAAVTFEKIIVTTIAGSRVTPVYQVAELFRVYAKPTSQIMEEPDDRQAFKLARTYAAEGCQVFCVGSLYLVGSLESQEGENQHD